jgi:hypothetical protein
MPSSLQRGTLGLGLFLLNARDVLQRRSLNVLGNPDDKKMPSSQDYHRALSIGLLQGSEVRLCLTIEVPLHAG